MVLRHKIGLAIFSEKISIILGHGRTGGHHETGRCHALGSPTHQPFVGRISLPNCILACRADVCASFHSWYSMRAIALGATTLNERQAPSGARKQNGDNFSTLHWKGWGGDDCQTSNDPPWIHSCSSPERPKRPYFMCCCGLKERRTSRSLLKRLRFAPSFLENLMRSNVSQELIGKKREF